MKTWNRPYQIVAVLMMCLHAVGVQAQLTTGGDVAGGYRQQHHEENGNLWLGYKASDYDWRLSLTAKYKDVEGETEVSDINLKYGGNPILTSTATNTDEKPFNLTARYDFNWRRPDKSAYSLWLLYDYEHMDFENAFKGTESASGETYLFFWKRQHKKDVSHMLSVGYRGATRLNTSGWTLKSNADVTLQNRHVNDAWQSYNQYINYADDSPLDTLKWELYPDYMDYTVNAGLELTDTVYNRENSRFVLGGGLRFKGEGERFRHDAEMSNPGDAISLEQESTGFRFFVEPFLNTTWQSGKWSVNAEYGLRLYRMTTTDKTSHAVQLYNFLDLGTDPLSGEHFSHFTPLVNGRAKLTFAFSKHHSLSLTNSISNRLPTNQQTVIRFVQTNEFNKVLLGNPDLKPEVRIQFSLDHALTYGPFTATTSVSAERTNHLMEYFFFGCRVAGRLLIAQSTINDANALVYRLSETLAWKNKWLKASATIWRHWAHYQGVEGIRAGREVDDKSWGWNLDAKADLGCGWQMATNFRLMGGFQTVATQVARMWQSSTVSIEKRFNPITLYLNANRLVDPTNRIIRYNSEGEEIYHSESRMNNLIVMLGCRWSL